MSATYPPEPWELRGRLHASALLVPLADIPLDLPPGWRPVRLGRYGVVGVAWVVYEPGGVLSYNEVMATLLVRRGARIVPHIVAIWVDSEASRDGGRELWGIPKELATFEVTGGAMSARDENGPIGRLRLRRRFALPGRWPVRFQVVQTLEGAAKLSPVRSRAGVAFTAAALSFDMAGPLGFLNGRKPLLSFTMTGFRMSFGARGGARAAKSVQWGR